MSLAIIRSAFESRLSDWAASQSPPIPISWQNAAFTPPAQARYLRAFLLPADTQDYGIADDVKSEIGVFQVSVCVPEGAGANPAEALADAIVALFPRALVMNRSGLDIQVSNTPSASPGTPEPGLYVVPINIRYRAEIST
jgi:hypothetical protein